MVVTKVLFAIFEIFFNEILIKFTIAVYGKYLINKELNYVTFTVEH